MTISPETEPASGQGDPKRSIYLSAKHGAGLTPEKLEELGYQSSVTPTGHIHLQPASSNELSQSQAVDSTETDADDAPK